MSGYPRPSAPTEAEAAREATRELHAAIKDARAVLRELGDAVETWTARGEKMQAAANEAADAIYRQAHADIGSLTEETAKLRAGLRQQFAEILGMQTPDQTFKVIVEQLENKLSPVMTRELTDMVATLLPELVTRQLQAMTDRARAARGRGKRA